MNLPCPFCQEPCESSDLLKRHISFKHFNAAVKCDHCEKTFESEEEFSAHPHFDVEKMKLELEQLNNDLAALDKSIEQAQQRVNEEMRERNRIEHERDNLKKQLQALEPLEEGEEDEQKRKEIEEMAEKEREERKRKEIEAAAAIAASSSSSSSKNTPESLPAGKTSTPASILANSGTNSSVKSSQGKSVSFENQDKLDAEYRSKVLKKPLYKTRICNYIRSDK